MSDRPLLKDLIRIPERVHQGDFVLRLTDGLARAEETVQSYVVTKQLERCFDDALGFIQGALEGRTSKACYLHGSFGSGKSHFMAVLDLLLAGDVRARSLPELASVVAKHNAWSEGRRFLMVPYHMIGAASLESALFGQYARHVRNLHPTAPPPGFYLGESLFEDARRLREGIGDETFFARLNEGGGDGGWGAIEGGWDRGSFEAATLEPPSGGERQRLVGDLIERIFTSYGNVTSGREEAFIGIDEGLAVMSRHAQGLGYDAVVLFLDELILWLATHAADHTFVSAEGSKLSKLVEAQSADRPIPLVGFVARQRDLRDLVGENVAGALQLTFADTLKYWEARFHRVTLEDRNLPVIAQRRILAPRSESARQTIDAAFEGLMGGRHELLETLLGNEGERAMFRQVYPFSPALVQTLIAVSSLLQRERTALKIMQQLLVDRREDLELGMLIPVGDLWDVIAEGDEPFTDATRMQFDNAKKLWTQKLLPLLERQHGQSWQDLREGNADPAKAAGLRNDARFLKTLLLSALVPGVEALKALTPPRLAALNHGSVRSPIPSREGSAVLAKLRNWAAEIGEIKITEDANPVITIQITGVDTEPVLANAAQFDNEGNRRRKIRDILFKEFGIDDGRSDDLFRNQGFVEYGFSWRNTRREVDLRLDSIGELTESGLKGRDGTWTVILGLPFDTQNSTAADHRAKIDAASTAADTLVWLPSHLSERSRKELGTLVRIDHLLVGDRLFEASRHLSASDREQARALLRNQQSQLEQRLRLALRVAYGIDGEPRDAVAAPLDADRHLASLDATFTPRPPVGANLKEALESLLDRLMAHRYPAHPDFRTEVKPLTLKKVYEVAQKGLDDPDRRTHVADKALRQIVAGITEPLQLGQMGSTHFALGEAWRDHFGRMYAQAADEPITVARLRGWIDRPRAMGLPQEAQNLIILVWTEQVGRSFVSKGFRHQPSLDRLDDGLELVEQRLPSPEDWDTARRQAAAIFDIASAELRNVGNAGRLAAALQQQAAEKEAPLDDLARHVEQLCLTWEVEPSSSARLARLKTTLVIVKAIKGTGEPAATLQAFAKAASSTAEAAIARLMCKAAAIRDGLKNFDWPSVNMAASLTDQRQQAAEALRGRVQQVLVADEHAKPLMIELQKVREDALNLLREGAAPSSMPPPPPPPPGMKVIAKEVRVDIHATAALEALEDLRRRLEKMPEARLDLSWKLFKRSNDG